MDKKPAKDCVYKAKWIVADSKNIIQDGFVYVENSKIKDIGYGQGPKGIVTIHTEEVLIPAFVNAHTHLELSALKGQITKTSGFKQWVKNLIAQRDATDLDTLKKKAWESIKEISDSGCIAIGDVSTLGLTWDLLLNSSLYSIFFKELLGNEVCYTNYEQTSLKNNVVWSVAGHAPHTTSPKLLKHGKTIAGNRPFSIHVAESLDESEFLQTGKGNWANFLSERNIDFSDWKLPASSSIKYLESLQILDENTIAVHLLNADTDDFEIMAKYKVTPCLCVRSNINLHGRVPDIIGMIKAGLKPCLGTDSLASVDSLNMFDEIRIIAETYPNLKPSEIFEMATINGSKALKFDHLLGTLCIGKRAHFFSLPINTKYSTHVIAKIVYYIT